MKGATPARSGGLSSLVRGFRGLNLNCWLIFIAGALGGLAQGIFAVDFNLYILSMGVAPDLLGAVLSAAPFAQAVGSIPIGFLADAIGFKRTFILVFGVSAVAKIAQLVAPSVPLIAAAAFLDGLALAGSFVVRLPFLAANAKPEAQTHVYTVNSMVFSVSMSLGSLLASYAPNFFEGLTGDLTLAYRYTLLAATGLTALAIVPVLGIKPTLILDRARPSVGDYLWKMGRFVRQQSAVTLLIGLSIGLTAPFMNLYFLYYLGTTREFYGIISALALVPALMGAIIVPAMAARTRSIVRLMSGLRALIPLFMLVLAVTANRWLGAGAYWMQNTLLFMTSPLAFAFAMDVARRSRSVMAAWLNIAFWIGQAIAAPVTGAFFAQNRYPAPMILAALLSALAAVLNLVLFLPVEHRLKQGVEIL